MDGSIRVVVVIRRMNTIMTKLGREKRAGGYRGDLRLAGNGIFLQPGLDSGQSADELICRRAVARAARRPRPPHPAPTCKEEVGRRRGIAFETKDSNRAKVCDYSTGISTPFPNTRRSCRESANEMSCVLNFVPRSFINVKPFERAWRIR